MSLSVEQTLIIVIIIITAIVLITMQTSESGFSNTFLDQIFGIFRGHA